MKSLKKLLLPAVFVFATLVAQAQSIELEVTSANIQVEIGQTATTTIKVKGKDGFNGQIFLKISGSDLPNAKNELSSDIIFPPYTESSMLSISPLAGSLENTYAITIEAFNGKLSVSKTILVQVNKSSLCDFKKSTFPPGTFIDNNGEQWSVLWSTIIKMSEVDIKYSLPDYEYRNRFIDVHNNFWFATNKGIVKFDGATASVFNASNISLPITDINFVIIDSSNAIWVANKNRLFKQNTSNWEEINLALPLNFIIADIKLDHSNNLWVASNNDRSIEFSQLSILQKISNKKIVTYNNTNSCLPKSHLNNITIDKNDVLWLGLFNGNTEPSIQNSILKFDGITWEFWCNKNATPNHFLFDKNFKQINSDQNSGFEGDYGMPVHIDGNDNKWIRTVGNGGTNRGLTKFRNQIWRNFDETNSMLIGYIEQIITSLRSKKVYVHGYVYEDCDEAPLATDANISIASEAVTISSQGNNLFQIKSQLNIDGLVLLNMNGTELRSDMSKTNLINVDYTAYPSGLYLVKVLSNDQVFTKKIRIQ